MAAIFDLRQTQASDSIPTSLSVLPNPINMGIAVGISLLSCSLDIPYTNVDTRISGLTAAIMNFWVISACVTIDKDLLEIEFTQQKT